MKKNRKQQKQGVHDGEHKNSETKQQKKKKKKRRNLRVTSKGRKELQSRRTI